MRLQGAHAENDGVALRAAQGTTDHTTPNTPHVTPHPKAWLPQDGRHHVLTNQWFTEHTHTPPTRTVDAWQVHSRKEVIQPHLPVRLPCYDFVPIADPTFDGSLPKGLGHRLRVLPTFMT